MALYQLPLLTTDEVAVLRHGLRRMVPDVPGDGLPTITSDDLRSMARSLDTALARATQRHGPMTEITVTYEFVVAPRQGSIFSIAREAWTTARTVFGNDPFVMALEIRGRQNHVQEITATATGIAQVGNATE